jgi:hypothetical protein
MTLFSQTSNQDSIHPVELVLKSILAQHCIISSCFFVRIDRCSWTSNNFDIIHPIVLEHNGVDNIKVIASQVKSVNSN